MRVLLGGFAAAALMAAPAWANGLPQATCRGWSAMATITQSGSTEAGKLTGTFRQSFDTRDGRYYADRDYGAFTGADGYDGRQAWSRDRSGASHALDAGPAKAIAVTEAWLRRRAWCGRNDATMTALPDEKDGDVALAAWRATPKGGTPAILRFDRSNGLLRQTEIRLWSTRLIRHFNDWHDEGSGVQVPRAERDEYPEDESSEIIKLTSVTVSNHPASASAYTQPPPPHDYAILNGKISATVPYEDDGVARIFVPVYIDGKGPFAFELDTGGHLILTSATASQLQLNAVGSFNGTGGGTGIVKQGMVTAHEVRIGDAVMREQSAKVVPLSEASNDRGPRLPRGGIVGLELFERFAVQLDRRSKTLTLTPLEHFSAPQRGTALPIHFIEDAPLAAGSFDGIPGDFELDSGDSGPAIVEGYWAGQHRLTDRLSHGLDWTGGGVGGEYHEILSRGDFIVGPVKLPHEIVSYVGLPDRGSESTQLQAGLVGESSLYRFNVTFDYARERVWLDPVPEVPLHAFNHAGLRIKKETAGPFTAAIVLPDSPAQAAGISEGDRINAIAGKPAAALSATDALVLLSGPVGSEVVLNLTSKTGGPARDIVLTLREMIP